MLLKKNTGDWDYFPQYRKVIQIELEDTITDEGFEIDSMDKLVDYLTHWKFASDYIALDYMREAIFNLAEDNLGSSYRNIAELVFDLKRNYI